MCHTPCMPIYLAIPVFLVSSVGKGIHSIDEVIRANNLRIMQLLSRQKNKFAHYTSERVEHESSCSIDEIKKVFNQEEAQVSDSDREELAKMLMQRCLARLESSDFKLAKQDVEEAVELVNKKVDEAAIIDSSVIFYHYFGSYLMGLCCNGLGEFSQAAKHFCQAIQYQERVEQIAADSSEKKDNLEHEIQERMLELEKEFFSMQLETKNPLDKVASSWTKGLTQYNTSMANLSSKVINFYNHNMKMGVDKPILKQAPVTYFTPELFHIRAGLSYYSGTFYTDALSYLTKAIEIGESYQSENVESSYYNRGLCYYYLGDLNMAIEDFTKSISLMPLLKQREQPYAMRAITYGRMGKFKERDADMKRIKLINPFAKSLPLFHLRLLNDDVLCNILSYLQTKQILVMSSLNRYSRGLVTNFLQHNDIEIGNYSMTVDSLTRQNNRSIVEKMFLPNYSNMTLVEILNHVINHPHLIENAKNVLICKPLDYNQSVHEIILKNYHDLKRITVFEINGNEIAEFSYQLRKNSPNITYFRIASDNFAVNHYFELIKTLPATHLRLPMVAFNKNPFEFTKLKLVEYEPLIETDEQRVFDFNDFRKDHVVEYLSWEEIKQLNPSITFIERKGKLHIDETSNSYFPVDCNGNKLWNIRN